MKNTFVIAAVAVIAVAVFAYFERKPSLESPIAGTASSDPEIIPTPQYLFGHPDALKQAERRCQDGDASSSLYCSNVQRAESLRMADQYRRALKPTGAAR